MRRRGGAAGGGEARRAGGGALSTAAAVREAGARLALVEADGRRTDWRALGEEVAAAAAWLAARGVGAGDPVELVPAVDRRTVVWVLAALERRAPLYLVHPRATEAERARQRALVAPRLALPTRWPEGGPGEATWAPAAIDAAARDSAARDVATSDAAARDAAARDAAAVDVAARDAAARDAAARDVAALDVAALEPEAPAAFVFTSGTTRAPKGAILPRRALQAACEASAARLGWRDDDRWLLSLPPAHVGGLSVILRVLQGRRALVLGPPRFDAAALADLVAARRVTILSLVPTMLHRLLEAGWRPPPALRVVLVGGAAASPALLARARAAGVPVRPTYGLTEACAQVATREAGDARPAPDVGPPLPGVRVRIVDGIIQVAGPTLFAGYLGEGPAPLVDGEWLATGDLGSLDACGRLTVLGRRGDLIVSGGENVAPARVEAALEAAPGACAACVFGVPDAEWGERVAAALVLREGASLEDALAAAARELASHERPRLVAVLDALPTNATGKLDRREAARRARERLAPTA